MRPSIAAALALLAITLSGYFFFPGHTYLQSDTQIYVPILERLHDPSLFSHELIAQRPHVSFTIYDEVTIALRRLTNHPFRDTLAWQQIATRFAALTGVFLLARAIFPASLPAAIAVTAIFGLGATVQGPSVLTFEYEPNPRGNALGFTFLAIGLIAQQRFLLAGCAAGMAVLYHVPAVYPYWLAYLAISLLPQRRPRLIAWLPMLASFALLLVFAHFQTGETERQSFLSTIDPEHAQMMRERASYNWISLWPTRAIFQYLLLYPVILLALYRLRHAVARPTHILILTLATTGMLSLPASYLLLEKLHWSLMPQIQPMRAALYVTAFAIILSAAAACLAAQNKRWLECFAFFTLALTPSASTRTIQYLFEPDAYPFTLAALAGAALLTATAAIQHQLPLIAASLSLAFLIPAISPVKNYPPLHNADLDALSAWARSNTSKNDIFLFPDAGRDLTPGVFRAEALRTVYVDWKGGGQINFLRDFLTTWRPRWQALMQPQFDPAQIDRYAPFGIHYVVVNPKNAPPSRQPVYQNPRFLVFRLP